MQRIPLPDLGEDPPKTARNTPQDQSCFSTESETETEAPRGTKKQSAMATKGGTVAVPVPPTAMDRCALPVPESSVRRWEMNMR